MSYPEHFLKLVETLRQLPGVGAKTAERYAFQMLDWKSEQLQALADVVGSVPHKLQSCSVCGCLCDPGPPPCRWCDPSIRQGSTLCVIASPRDAFAVEETGSYRGHFHVLGGTLSPLEGRGPESLNVSLLKQRVAQLGIEELIIALDSTLEGDATALYLKKEFADTGLQLTRLAFGIPMGSALDYVDGGTLARALSGRSAL